ncbi:MAG TPA: hypothetical protein VHA34_16910 [Actinomycetes bacterium]|nr:hypothetical protein [Actinomycetes bacterium]
MPESPNQASSGQRRANWVALRTLRQLPKPAGETAGGEPVYEVRSVKLLLDGTAANFVRLTECSRCGRELAGAPVLTAADLDRPLRPMICTDCIRSAGVSTVWEPEGGEPVGERLAPAPVELPAGQPDPKPAAAHLRPERLDVLEGHLRAVTDRVNELGRVARAHQADVKERARREEATASDLRDGLASLRASADDTRAELRRLAEGQAEMERRWAESAPAREAATGVGQLREELAQLARLVEAQRGEVIGFVAAVGETQTATRQLALAQEALAETVAQPPAEPDLSKVEELITTRVAEAEGRLAHLVAGQWGDLETAIEGSVNAHMARVVRANEELAHGQAALEERMEALAAQVAQTCRRMEALVDRLHAVNDAAPTESGPDSGEGSAGSFLDGLDRQLEAAARRLAARAQAGARRGEQ